MRPISPEGVATVRGILREKLPDNASIVLDDTRVELGPVRKNSGGAARTRAASLGLGP